MGVHVVGLGASAGGLEPLQQFLSAVPVPDPAIRRQKIVLEGDVPSPMKPPSGCHFHTRCPIAQDRCKVDSPPLREVGGGQKVACHFR